MKNIYGQEIKPDENVLYHGYGDCDNCDNGADLKEDEVVAGHLLDETNDEGHWVTCPDCGRKKFFGYV